MTENNSIQEDHTNMDLPAGLKLRETLRGHSSNIHRIAWSPKDDILSSPAVDHTFRIWKGGKQIEMLKDSVGRFIAGAWSPDGSKLALASDNDILRLWDVASGNSERTRSGGFGYISCLDWDARGEHVATGALNGSLTLWDSEFKNSKQFIKKSKDKIFCLAFSKHYPLLAIGLQSGLIRLWDMVEQKEMPVIEIHKGPVYTLTFSRTGNTLYSAGADASIKIWDVDQRSASTLKGHQSSVSSISISHDNTLIATKSSDQTIRIWSLEIEEQLASIPEAYGGSWLAGIAFHPTKPMLATLGEEDKTIRVWDYDYNELTGG